VNDFELDLSHLLFIESTLRCLREGKFLDRAGDIDIAIWGAVLTSLVRHNVAYVVERYLYCRSVMCKERVDLVSGSKMATCTFCPFAAERC